MPEFFHNIEPCLVGIEACGSAYCWANAISKFGHAVRLMQLAHMKAYVERSKTDTADVDVICEALPRLNDALLARQIT